MSKERDQESKRERTNPKIILLVAATMRVLLSILKMCVLVLIIYLKSWPNLY